MTGTMTLRVMTIWAVTRGVVIVWWAGSPHGSETVADLNRFAHFATEAPTAISPSWFPWEYPALARMLISPDLGLSVPNYVRFVMLLLLAVDAAFTLWLSKFSGRLARPHAVWLWVLVMPLLGALPFTRYDLAVAVLVAVAIALFTRYPQTAAAATSVAIALKLWPLLIVPLLVAATPRDQRPRVALWLLLPWVLAEAIGTFIWGWRSSISPLQWQQDRGMQFESIPATVGYWLRDEPHQILYRYNAYEISGFGLLGVGFTFLGIGIMVIVVVMSWRRLGELRELGRPLDAELAAAAVALVATLVATGKVLSPQYLLWLLAPAAVAFAVGAIRGRLLISLLGAACALTTISYPFNYVALVNSEDTAWVFLAVRNICLVAVAVLLIYQWYRATPSTETTKGRALSERQPT